MKSNSHYNLPHVGHATYSLRFHLNALKNVINLSTTKLLQLRQFNVVNFNGYYELSHFKCFANNSQITKSRAKMRALFADTAIIGIFRRHNKYFGGKWQWIYRVAGVARSQCCTRGKQFSFFWHLLLYLCREFVK